MVKALAWTGLSASIYSTLSLAPAPGCVLSDPDQTSNGVYIDCESLWAQGALSHLSESSLWVY